MKKHYNRLKILSLFVLIFFATSIMAQEVVNTAFGPGSGNFTLEFDVVPSNNPMNGGVGLSNGDVGTWADMSCIIGFHTVDGAAIFRAYNGSGYEKINDIVYEAEVSYHINMSVNVDAQTYSVDITPDGGTLTNLATDYGFRKAATELNNYASYNDTNTDFGGVPGATMDVTNFVLKQDVTNTAFGPSTSKFSLEFDVIPSHSPMNGGVGLADGDVTGWGDMSCIIGFHTEGLLTARNGSAYEKMNDIPYEAGKSYHFKMDVNIATQTYSVDVTPEGGTLVNLATDYGFRKAATELNTYTSFNDSNTTFGGIVGASMKISNFDLAQDVYNTSFDPIDKKATIDFDVVPSHSPMNGGVGLADGIVGAWGDMSSIIGFHQEGLLRAYNGSGYEKMNDIPYEAGKSYHFTMDVDVAAQTYTIDVTPEGGTLVNLATDYAFRKAVTELNTYTSYNDSNTAYGGVPGASMVISNFSIVKSFPTKSTNIPKTKSAPVIDGDAADWDSYEAHAIEYDANGAGSSATDFSGYWKATWTDTELYLMAEINDDTLYNAGSPLWSHDAVNFFIGLNGRNGLGASNDPNKNMYNYWWGPGDFDGINSVDTSSHATASKKWDKADGSGYIIEWSISFEELKLQGYDITFEEGTSFLLDVTAVDDDDEISNYNVWGWSFDGSSWTNMDNTGDVTLTGVPHVASVGSIHKTDAPPAIDGNIDDWADIEANALTYDANGIGHDPADFSGYWKAVWTDDELIMMADITDDALWNEGSAFWNHDAVNFYIGLNGDNGAGASNDDHKYIFNYWWAPGESNTIDGITDENTIKKWDKADGSGYVIEWKIRFDSLNANDFDIMFEEGTTIQFDVVAVDDDDAIDDHVVWGWSADGASWTNMDKTGDLTLIAAKHVTNSTTINKSTAPPAIDGDVSDWADIPANDITFDANGIGYDAADFSGYWKAVWTDDELIMMADITDDVLWNEGSAFWNHDAVNFYIGLNGRNGLGASNDVHKWIFNYWWAPGESNTIGGITDENSVKKWDKADGSGYVIEWKIRFDSLNTNGFDINFEQGTSILFDVVAVDDDDAVDDHVVWGWSADGASWTNMDNTGDVTLIGLVDVRDFENERFAVHPNPVKDQMTINGFSNISTIEMYNLQGQKILSKSISSNDTEIKLDINTFNPGAYVLRLIGERNYSATIIVKE